ncbi:MAG: SRPBCC family protein, partial [Caulobacteraceae bacterium]
MNEKIKGMLPDIERTITIDASIQKVWAAIATPEGLASWLMQNTFKPEMGYEFTFQAKPMGDWNGVVHCKVMELNPPKRLGFTWCGNNMEQYVSFELIELEEEKT